MKLKILLVPTIIALNIILVIWFIVPAFSDSVTNTGVMQKYAGFKAEEKKMANLDNKMNNVKSLASELATTADKDVIYGYVPENKNEEEIIGNLNLLAATYSVSVMDLSLSEVKDPIIQPTQIESGSSPATALAGQAGSVVLTAPIPKAKNLEVKYSIVGKYQDIKTVIDSVYKLKRFNNISSLQISALATDDNSTSENLKANLVLNFNYFGLSKSKQISAAEAENTVFSSNKFDLSIADQIRSNKSTEVIRVDSGERGKMNPFLP